MEILIQYFEDLWIDGRLILNWILYEQDIILWNGIIWFRVGFSGRIL
jgi:hypothetical protein